MSPKILLEKNKEWKKKKQKKTRTRKEKKEVMAALLVFMLTSLEIVFERRRLFAGKGLFWL